MKPIIFCLILFLPLFTASSHKSHQNQTIDPVRYGPVRYSSTPLPDLPAIQNPRFISNSNNMKANRLYSPLQIRQMFKSKQFLNQALPSNVPKFRITSSENDYEVPDDVGMETQKILGSDSNKEALNNDNSEVDDSERQRSVNNNNRARKKADVENSDENRKNNNKNNQKIRKNGDETNRNEENKDCDCGATPKCPPCGYGTPGAGECRCAATPEAVCPSCNVGKAIRQIHEAAQKEVRWFNIEKW